MRIAVIPSSSLVFSALVVCLSTAQAGLRVQTEEVARANSAHTMKIAQRTQEELETKLRSLQKELDAVSKKADQQSRPLVGKAPPDVLPPTKDERLQREKERAVERSIRDDAISTDRQVRDLLREKQ